MHTSRSIRPRHPCNHLERVLRLLADMNDAESSLSSASALPAGRLRVDVPSPLARMRCVAPVTRNLMHTSRSIRPRHPCNHLERVLRLLADMNDAESSLSSASALPAGRLRVDVPSPLARMILIPALPAFHALYPDIQIDMGVSDRMVDVIGDQVDCVIRGGAMRDLSLHARRVGDLQIGVYAAPAYLARAGLPAHPRDLEQAQHRIVGFRSTSTGKLLQWPMHKDGEAVAIDARYTLAVDDGNAYLAAGRAGLGVLWLLDYMARPHLASGELVRLFDDWQMAPMALTIAWSPNRHVSARLRVFIDWVAQLLAQHQDTARQD